MEVPLAMAYAVSLTAPQRLEPPHAEMMSTPGANSARHGPVSDQEYRMSLAADAGRALGTRNGAGKSEPPTAKTLGTLAGTRLQALPWLLPAAAVTNTPALVTRLVTAVSSATLHSPLGTPRLRTVTAGSCACVAT